MIDKIFAFFIFFVFLFSLLFYFKSNIINQTTQDFNFQMVQINIVQNKSFIKQCQFVIKSNNIFIFQSYNDNFNPKIKGYSILTEHIVCNFNYLKSGTKINFTLKN
ncbi:MAG: hypothetical protein ABGW69_01035 [Nanoarchaeota archaeon]